MSLTPDTTTLICLFHHDDQAKAALDDLYESGISAGSITTVRGGQSANPSSELAALGIPSRDLEHLQNGLNDGGSIISVTAASQQVSTVERIFGDHRAKQIDEVGDDSGYAGAAAPLAATTLAASATGETVIPIVEEELAVGKRTVDQGGVRVYRRVVEIPAEQSVNLREERVIVERTPVDRVATQADLAAQGSRTIELTETAEEAVVGKTARVVEEVLIGKQTGEHTETIHDTVRRTQVELEELPSTETKTKSRNF